MDPHIATVTADAFALADGFYGETFRIAGMLPASGQRLVPAPDPSRPAFEVEAVRIADAELRGVSPRLNNAEAVAQKPGWQGQSLGILVSEANLAWRPAPGDRVTRLASDETFAVMRLADRGHGRIAVMLAR